MDHRIEGFICEAAFRIEAVRKNDRPAYFARPQMKVTFPSRIVSIEGKPHIHFMSMGPNDGRHPGLPDVQANRLELALSVGLRLMRGLAWMGLPSPLEIGDPRFFVQETESARGEREQLQIAVSAKMWKRGVGKQAFDAAGGWQAIEQGTLHEKKFSKACAEWADGELVAAHIAYQHDILCTNDRAQAAGTSIFDARNRTWLNAQYGVVFKNFDELIAEIAR